MNNLFKMLGLLAFVLFGLGSAQTPANRYESEKNAIIKKWTESNPKSFDIVVGMSFESLSQISENAGQGPLTQPLFTGWRDIFQSETMRTKELRTWNALGEEPNPIYFWSQPCVDCLVKNSLIVASRSAVESRKVEATEKIAREEATRVAAREKNTQDEQRRKQEAQQKFESLRAEARNDVVAQALNYVSGNGEDANGAWFYYAINKDADQCIYSRSDISQDPKINEFNAAMNMFGAIMGMNTTTDPIIDLNKGDPRAIEFFSRHGHPMFPDMQNPPTYYITKVEGVGTFECTNCNGDRVQRAWALIYKQCKGNRKAF